MPGARLLNKNYTVKAINLINYIIIISGTTVTTNYLRNKL